MKSRFVFNSGQRNGIFVLILIVVVLLGVMYWVKHRPQNDLETPQEIQEEQLVQEFVDSLKSIKSKPKKYKVYPFNPNFITDYKGYKLGMSPEEIDRLHKFRKQDSWIDSKAQFQNVTKVSDSLLNEISPYFKFPDWVIANRNRKAKERQNQSKELSYSQKTDLNTASTEDLQKVSGIGEVLSRRIIRYRSKIEGFVDKIQLKDVYGLNYETQKNLLAKFAVKSNTEVKKLDINKATTAELTEIVYFNYELARRIVNYRITHQGITSFEELAKVDGFPAGRIDRLKLYLKI